MPIKSTIRTRDQQQQPRAWGTRFDSLTTSPTLASIETPILASSVADAVVAADATSAEAEKRDAVSASAPVLPVADGFSTHANKLSRDWADDEVPISLVAPTNSPLNAGGTASESCESLDTDTDTGACATDGNVSYLRRDSTNTKMPHDASVYIGGLPIVQDEEELKLLLCKQFDKSATIENIKVVRDTKGGMCAFIQCKNAGQAATVVQQAQSDPQPFMGRYLRIELAKAFRSLFISFRKPLQFIPTLSGEADTDGTIDENAANGRWAEAKLPSAMRIWRPLGARYPIVSYGNEAHDNKDIFNQSSDATRPGDSLEGEDVAFPVLKFNKETIKKIAEAFGPLELFETSTNSFITDDGEPLSYPPGHDYPRSENMDNGVWEVKWGHRDDCFCALSTLKRVPFLTVTRANENNYSPTLQRSISRQGHLYSPMTPRYYGSSRPGLSPTSHSGPHLLLGRDPSYDAFRSREHSASDSHVSPTFSRPINVHAPKTAFPLSPTLAKFGNDATRRRSAVTAKSSDAEESEDGWTVVRSHNNITRAILSSFTDSMPNPTLEKSGNRFSPKMGQEDKREAKAPVRSPKWSENDFPPLKTFRSEPMVPPSVSERIISLDDSLPASPKECHVSLERIEMDSKSVSNATITSPRPHFLHRRSLSNPVARLDLANIQPTLVTDTPSTPDLANDSHLQTPISALPRTPIHSLGQLSVSECQETGAQCTGEEIDEDKIDFHGRERDIDPKTVFVGGLEHYGPMMWDEERLRLVFSRYGDVQNVQVVNPPGKKSAFAFVTYFNEEGPLKAIQGEHNRNYDGRSIRVQLRDTHQIRGGFKGRGRGFGRIRHIGYDSHFAHANRSTDFNVDYGMPNRYVARNAAHQSPEVFERTIENEITNISYSGGTTSYQQMPASISSMTDSATLFSSTSFEGNPEGDLSQESDSRTAVSLTPPPGTTTVTANVNSMPAPHSAPSQAMGHYPAHAWGTPYAPQMHFPVPLGAYPGMVPPVPMPVASASANMDNAGINPAMQWAHMYRPTIPYTPFPYIPVIAPEAPRNASMSQPPTPVKGQPPLHPTGFIQGEHGTLIPVYQPEALDEYMNGASVQAQNSSAVPSYPVAPIWSGYPQQQPVYAYPLPQAVGISSSTTPPATVQQQMVHHHVHGHPLQHINSATPNVTQSTAPVLSRTTSHYGPIYTRAQRPNAYAGKYPSKRDTHTMHQGRGTHLSSVARSAETSTRNTVRTDFHQGPTKNSLSYYK